MIQVNILHGGIESFKEPLNLFQIAKKLDPTMVRFLVAGKVNGKLVDMNYIVDENASIEFIKADSKEGENIIRHSAAHLMAQSVINLFPGTKVTIGPSIEYGFYYDFDPKEQFTEEDIVKIENEMKKLVKKNIKIERIILSKNEAINYFKELGEIYKVELIEEIPENETITLYKQGEFIDLCRGPHVPSTNYLKNTFKLMSIAGAYWRGNSNNKMLQRIYGIAFSSKEKVESHLELLKEAEKRDHRKLGKELDLFMFSEHGPGFAFYLPKGMIIKNILENLWKKEHIKAGYKEINTPIMLDKNLWEISGHWFNYRENMYTSEIDDLEYAIKPMNCPGAMMVYNNSLHSYKELPVKYAELGLVHRHEFSGALHGLMRVRSFTQDDAHVFCLPSQVVSELVKIIELYDKFYTLFDFEYYVEISTKPEKAIGSDEVWDISTKALIEAVEKKNIKYSINEGDGAFYGPKIDYKMKDAIGRIWQCGTIQLDFNLPERFDLSYIGEDNNKHKPVMIHRAMYGSLDRFIGILTEHYAGIFPLWLAPVQVKIMTVVDDSISYAQNIHKDLLEIGIRSEIDIRSEKIGYKIREANGKYKIPIQLIIGKNEMNGNTVNIRYFGDSNNITKPYKEFLEEITKKIKIKL